MKTTLKIQVGDKDFELHFVKGHYRNSGNLAVVGLIDGEADDYISLTVNLMDPLLPNCAYLDVNNLNAMGDIIPWLEAQEVIKPTGKYKQSGYAKYPLVEFNAKWLMELPEIK